MGFEAFHQQVVDSSKVVVAFVLQRLKRKKKRCIRDVPDDQGSSADSTDTISDVSVV